MRAEDQERRQRRREAVRILVRTTLWATVLVAAYYVIPLERPLDAGIAVLAVGLLLIAVVLFVQVRAIVSSPFPRLRAIGALGVGVPLLLVVFASVYYLMAYAQPGSFDQPLDKTASLYFTITVFATVGFGDIVPVSGAARIVTSVHMLVDLFVFGVIAKLIFGAVQLGLQRLTGGGNPPGSTAGAPPESQEGRP